MTAIRNKVKLGPTVGHAEPQSSLMNAHHVPS